MRNDSRTDGKPVRAFCLQTGRRADGQTGRRADGWPPPPLPPICPGELGGPHSAAVKREATPDRGADPDPGRCKSLSRFVTD